MENYHACEIIEIWGEEDALAKGLLTQKDGKLLITPAGERALQQLNQEVDAIDHTWEVIHEWGLQEAISDGLVCITPRGEKELHLLKTMELKYTVRPGKQDAHRVRGPKPSHSLCHSDVEGPFSGRGGALLSRPIPSAIRGKSI